MSKNHPNRGQRSPASTPTPDEIKEARAQAGLTQPDAASLIYSTVRTWQDWESGARRMHPAMFELWRIKVAHTQKV